MGEAFLAVLGVSATVGLVALALALLSRPLNRHAAARWKYWVWLVLAVRLLLPFDLALPASPARVELPAAVQQPLAPAAPPASGGAPASAPGGAAENLPAGQVPQAPAPAPAPAVSTRDVLAALALVWLAGAALCGVCHLGSSLRFYRRAVRWARPPSAPATRQLWELCRQDLGVRRARLLVNPAVPCPMAAGLFQPTVLLPTEEMDPGDLSCVLRHELTHLKRGDLWYRLVLLAAACLHWFNPLVWLLLRQAWADLELRCDDEVLRAAPPEQRRAYSEAILACIRQGQGRAPVLTTYFRGGKGSLARRFSNILTPGKKRGGALVLAATLATTALLGALVGCSVAAPAASADPAAPDVPQGYKQVFVDFAPYAKARTGIQGGGEAAPRSIRCQVLDGVEGWEEQKPALRASLQLPEGWQLRPAQAGEACLAAGVNAPFNLYDQAGSLVGTLGYDTYFEGQINGDDDFYGHGYKARYYWIMSGNVSWDNAYTPVSQTETTENAVCRVSYLADASPTGLAFENDGILAWDDRLMRYAALELAAGAAAPEQLAAIAASLTLLEDVLPAPTPAADPAPVAPEGFARRSITMPAYGGWETPYNGSIYNVAPFTVTLALPEGFAFQVPADASEVEAAVEDSTLWGKVPILQGGRQVGALLYNVYEPLPPEEATENPRAVYSTIMVPNHMGWDFEYTEVSRTATASSATCLAGFHSPVLPAPADPATYLWEDGGEQGWDMWYKKGVLSHEDTLGVYIAMYFDYNAVTDEQLTAIAQSILLSPAAA